MRPGSLLGRNRAPGDSESESEKTPRLAQRAGHWQPQRRPACMQCILCILQGIRDVRWEPQLRAPHDSDSDRTSMQAQPRPAPRRPAFGDFMEVAQAAGASVSRSDRAARVLAAYSDGFDRQDVSLQSNVRPASGRVVLEAATQGGCHKLLSGNIRVFLRGAERLEAEASVST